VLPWNRRESAAYPNGYRDGYDAQAKDYRIALTGFT